MFIHIDLDCYFVSAHRTLDKNLLNIAVAVGGRNSNDIFSNEKLNRKLSINRASFSSKIISSNIKNNENYFIDENGKIRGIITTASYEARAFGVKTAMSVNEALRICPHLKMIAPNYELYDDLSNKLKEIGRAH